MIISFIILTVCFSLFSCANQDNSQSKENNGLIIMKSANSVEVTLKRLKSVLEKNKDKGLGIALEWSHSTKAEESKAKIDLKPTELILFGNPNLGSHLFTSKQSIGIDLPMKALIWEDANGDVWLAYNDPDYIAQHHGINDRKKILEKMKNALHKMTEVAIQSN